MKNIVSIIEVFKLLGDRNDLIHSVKKLYKMKAGT